MTINASLIRFLTRLRDSRLLWESLGAIYNRRIYTAIADLYHRVAGEMILPSGAHILDAGCGRGYVALQLAENQPETQITGIDYSIRQVIAARKLQRQKRAANCTFEQGNVMKLRFDNESFDAAVSIGSIKHWPDALRGIGEIHRVLKPGGTLIIAETDQGASAEEVLRFMTRFNVWFVPDRLLFWGLRHVIFGQSYTQASLADAIGKAGFKNMAEMRVADCPYVILKAIKSVES